MLLAAGALDPTFNGDGIAPVEFPDYAGGVGEFLIQPDGKILIASSIGDQNGNLDNLLVRLNPDGTLDPYFGQGGFVRERAYYGGIHGAVLQSDGRIVTVGAWDLPLGEAFAVSRYMPDGNLDPTFGTGGHAVAPVPGPRRGTAVGVAVQPDGKIVLGGTSFGEIFRYVDITVARVNADGSLDEDFGEAGFARIPTTTEDRFTALALQPDGKIAAAGLMDTDYGIVRFNADGTPDTSFGGDGMVTTDFGSFYDVPNDLVALPDGRLLAGGARALRRNSSGATLGDVTMARYQPDGSLDPTFGNGGRVMWEFPPEAFGYIESLTVNPSGRIIAVGNSGSETSDGIVMAFDEDGRVDTSFGGGGLARDPVARQVIFSHLALQPDGRVLTLGRSFERPTPFNDFPVFRFLGPDGPLTARAGGPFSLAEGERVILQGDASGDADVPITAFEWDLDYDGTTFDVDVSGAAPPLYTPAGIDGPATRTLGFRVRDAAGNVSNVSTTTMTIRNVAPAVAIEGPTDARPEGTSVTLSASVTDPSAADTAAGFTYAWTVTRGGQKVASGDRRDFTFTPDDEGTYAVTLTVTDKDGGSSTATATVEAANAAPAVTLADPAPVNPVPFQAAKFSATFADPGAADRLEVAWDFGDGTTLPFHAAPAGADAPTHAYAKPGEYTVTVTVRDDDGAATSRSLKVKVEPVAIQVAPCDPAQKWLAVGGTAGNDVITFTPSGRAGAGVGRNGVRSGPYSDVRRIFAFGGPGRDVITVSGSVKAPALLDGGDGSDLLTGGGGDDVLLGGAGLDVLVGVLGRDTLVGGMGYDLLVGGRQSTQYEGDADVTVTCAGITVTPVRRRPPRDM